MDERLKKLVVIIIIGVVGVAVILKDFGLFFDPYFGIFGLPIIHEPLEQVPPADPVPGRNPIFVEIDNLTISVTPRFELHLLHRGNFYNLQLTINITNNGPTDITDFSAGKVSVYGNTSQLYYTFGLLTQDNTTVPEGETRIITYTQDRRMPLVYSMWGDNFQYARVLATLGNSEVILTSPLSYVAIGIE
ncbi:MAG: hypothetical protein ACFFAY_16415 [Promethearchaeota archaeon]